MYRRCGKLIADGVGAVAAIKGVVAGAAEEEVVAGVAVELVVAGITIEPVGVAAGAIAEFW